MPNQATSFAAARAENFLAVHLNTSQFAEQVTYFFRDGSTDASIPVMIRVRRETRQDAFNEYDQEVAEVTIALDPTGASGLKSEPARGDAINRTQYGDSPDKRWAYAGRVLRSTSHSWTLEFVRDDLVQAGTVKGI